MANFFKTDEISTYFPFLTWIKDLKDPKILKSDIIAGITVAFILIPQSMAYAGLAGLPIYIGLYTSFISVIVAALFGSSKQMSTGPITIVSLMTATAIANMGIINISIEAYIVYASLIAFFIGIFYLLLSILKLGIIVEFLSNPVIIGFTNAVALITLISQAGKLFGVDYDKGNFFYEGIFNLIKSIINNVEYNTLMFGGGTIILLYLIGKISKNIPKVLIVLIISIIISYYSGYSGEIVKSIPNSLPGFELPFLNKYVMYGLNLNQLINLFLMSMIIGLIGFTQSISVAKFVGTNTKQSISANSELIGQGLANISSSLFGGYGVAGSFSKTAVNLRAGAKTGFSSVITGIMVLLSILYLTPFLYYLPIATLAAIIIVAVSDLIKIKPIIKAFKVDKYDGIVAVITFIMTLFLSPSIEFGIIIGIILSLALFIYKSMRPRLVEVSMYKDGLYRDSDTLGLKTCKEISIFRFDSELFFANAGYFESTIFEFIFQKNKLKYVIIDMEWVSNIDSSGLEVLENLILRLEDNGIKIYLTSLRVKVIRIFQETGFLKEFGKKNIFIKIETALKHIKEKEGDNIDLEVLFRYSPNKKYQDEVEKNIQNLLDKIVENN